VLYSAIMKHDDQNPQANDKIFGILPRFHIAEEIRKGDPNKQWDEGELKKKEEFFNYAMYAIVLFFGYLLLTVAVDVFNRFVTGRL
jgi:hypothetical protein